MLVAPPVFVVADGMGGHAGGDVASRIVVEQFAAMASSGLVPGRAQGQVQDTLARAQSQISAYADTQRADHPRWHAGTTCVAALVIDHPREPHWLFVNLGDSRIYAFHDNKLLRVSTDHSVVQELVDAGEITPAEAAVHPERHVITRALGTGSRVQPDFFRIPLNEAERILLCSDGISGMIDDQTIAELMYEHDDPRDCADHLVRAALNAGGRDNATAVVIDVVGLRSEHSYDSADQMASLEDKLGARP